MSTMSVRWPWPRRFDRSARYHQSAARIPVEPGGRNPVRRRREATTCGGPVKSSALRDDRRGRLVVHVHSPPPINQPSSLSPAFGARDKDEFAGMPAGPKSWASVVPFSRSWRNRPHLGQRPFSRFSVRDRYAINIAVGPGRQPFCPVTREFLRTCA